jgi:large subunit ribosomal protein L21
MSKSAETFAIFKAKGKQFGVKKGQTFSVDQLQGDVGSSVVFDEVLLVSDSGATKVGSPTVSNAKVTAKIIAHFRDKKVVSYKKNITHGFTKKIGHRQYKTRLVVQDIAA